CMGVFERPPTLTLDTIIRNRLGPVVVLVDIQDPGNMGTIIRSACAFGAAALMTVGNCTDPFSPKVIRASAGQVFRLPLIEVEDTATLIAALNTHPDLPVYATTPNQGRPYQYLSFTPPYLLLLGSEAHGLPQALIERAEPVQITTQKTVESLNVAMAATTLLAHAYQQGRAVLAL
ncbi:MAG: RNA methyltransferase, partial [Cyanobacteria bacterium HKST-UBA05]|nr:RNA methyltransferase [Cyanobacteria bacterium HKST-UBA05]